MKLIITNISDFLDQKDVGALIKDGFLKLIRANEYLIDLPTTTFSTRIKQDQFSIHENTLYYGLQWIGTLSKRTNIELGEEEITVHMNQGYSRKAIHDYYVNLKISNSTNSLSVTDSVSSTSRVPSSTATTAQSAEKATDSASTQEVQTSKIEPFVYTAETFFFSPGTSNTTTEVKSRKLRVKR